MEILADFFHQIHLQLLDIHQMLPLMHHEMVHPFVQLANLDFRLQIDLKVILGPEAVLGLLAVLAHHDHRGLNCGQAG